MFFRASSSKKSPLPILQLVQSQRENEKITQKIIISLGRMEIKKEIRREVADRIEAVLTGQESLFKTHPDIEHVAQIIVKRIQTEGKWLDARRVKKLETHDERIAEVFIDQIEHTNTCELGPELVAYSFWKKLGFDELLTKLGFSQIDINATAINVISRLVCPKSENSLPDWVKSTGLPEIMEIKPDKISKMRYYRVSDKLLENQEKIECALTEKETDLFSLKRSIYLYDLTNTYFEGNQDQNPKAKYSGKSKEKRNDCPQVAVGLVVDGDGFPIRHKLFTGNTSDSATLVDIVNELKIGCKHEPTIIVDAGMSKPENLSAIRGAGFHYIAAKKRNLRENHADIFADDILFRELPDRDKKKRVLVYKKDYEEHSLLFCKSEGRAEKEIAIKSAHKQKLEIDLQKLRTRIQKGKLKNQKKIQQAIGRLLERHSRVARFYDIEITTKKSVIALNWSLRAENINTFDGCYTIQTSRKNLKDNEIWNIYMTLLQVEKGFRDLKSHLGLRPNYHRKESRVDGHIFITVLAYHLLHSIEHTLRQNGDHSSWPTIRQSLKTHAYTTMLIPTVAGHVINLRKPGLPDNGQKQIYTALNVRYVNLPTRKVLI